MGTECASGKPLESGKGDAAKYPDTLEKWLWIDPFTKDTNLEKRIKTGAVLLAEDIIRYIQDYNIVVDKGDFTTGTKCGAKMKGASYTMTPDPDDAWMYEKDGQLRVLTIEVEKDQDGKEHPYYVVPHHSLAYIKLRQQLRVPFYLIGRHNLKISYVYQGLLLGTGPQVDPGYIGNLIIPLHNLTTRDVRIYINKSFVSIDFVRTAPLVFEGAIPNSLDELYRDYGDSKHLLDRVKVTSRVHLRNYLGTLAPQSAMLEIMNGYQRTIAQLEQTQTKVSKAVADFEVGQTQLKTEVTTRLSDMENAQQSLQRETADMYEKADTKHKIEIWVVAGLLITVVLGIIIPGMTWVRSDYSHLDGKLEPYEKRLLSLEAGQATNIVAAFRAELSGSISNVNYSNFMDSSNILNADVRIEELEAQLVIISNQMAISGSSNSATKPKH